MERSRLSNSSFGSPVKTSHFHKLEQDKKYILKKMHYLFVVYASRASRYSYREMNEKSFMELMTDAYQTKGFKLIKNSQAWKKIVTLYYGKGKKSSMDYQSFLKILPGMSELFSKSQTTQEGLKYLLKHLMIVYEDHVSREIQHKYVQFDNTFTHQTVEYLTKLQDSLYTVYKLYFPEEINNVPSNQDKVIFDIYDQVVLLFKQFEIYPKIISASHLYLIFLEIANEDVNNAFTWADQKHRKKDRLSSFGFSRYLQLLVRVAVVSIDRLRQMQDPEWWLAHQKQCLKALFEYMENVRTKSKNSRFHHTRFSFIAYGEYKIQKEKWQALAMDPHLKPMASRGDFFDIFEKMQL